MFQQVHVSMAARRQLVIHVILPLAYIICGRFGLLLAVPPGYATAVFLPAGIAVGGMFIAGAATLSGTFVGSFLLNMWIGYSIAHRLDATGIAAALVIAFASMLQAAVGGTALRRLIGYPTPLDTGRDLLLVLLLSPIFCVTSATLSLSGMWALGVVEPAHLIINWMTWWVGDTLGVLVALPLMLVLAGQPRRLWRSRARSVAVPMLLCFALFVGIFVRVTRWEHEESLLEFRMQSQRIADVMRAALDEQALFLGQLSKVFSTRVILARADFHDLAQELLHRFPTIQAVEWAPRVMPAERAAFETAQRTDLPGFAIRERDASRQLRLAGNRSQFYPVTYIEPLGGNEEAVGFDLASTAERRAAIEAAITSGAVTATAPIVLVQEHGAQAGILLMHAASGPTGAGIILIALRMGTFLSTLTDPLASTLQLRFVDTAAQPLFDTLPASTHALYEIAFDFGARRYLVQTAPSPLYLARHRGWQSWTVLAAGVLGTGLLGALLMLGTGQAYRFELLADDLRAREAELETIVKRTPFILIRCSPDLRYRFVSEAYARMIRRRPEEIIGQPLREIIGEEGFKTVLPHIKKVLAGERAEYDCEVHYQGVGRRFLHGVYMPEKDEQGHVIGWIASIADITERKRAESQRDLLVAELSHRVKNTLATVISIAHLSFSKARSADEARRSFDERIRALAQTHARLAEANWSGVSLEAIIRDETAPYQDGVSNVLIGGPNITLSPKTAVSLGMAIHELATNAAKHGALSTKVGSLEITWQFAASENEVQISWIESGGPSVSEPQHSGFGRMLLERALASDLNGKVKLDFAKEGLNCLIAFPLDRQSAATVEDAVPDRHAVASASADRTLSPSGKSSNETRILIVEDESLLAMELKEFLQAAGYKIVGPFSDLARATEAAHREPIDLAVLDSNLNGEMVYPLADELSAQGVPFIFVTGYGAPNLPERFRSAPRVSKPFDPAALINALQRLFTPRSTR
jgi:PAS domain S-box-containing protein